LAKKQTAKGKKKEERGLLQFAHTDADKTQSKSNHSLTELSRKAGSLKMFFFCEGSISVSLKFF